MCLMNSTKTISEIAYALGFEDPSYFARYYKKQTGHAPSGLRRNNNL
jgi:AraC-like DNA-binding protein